jgi:hypothetical protein
MGYEWMQGIRCCSHFLMGSENIGHEHVDIEGGEENKKKRFFR